MSNWRVVRMRDADGMFIYTIEDVAADSMLYPGLRPFVKHVPPYPVADSVDGLRDKLIEMLNALTKPAMVYHYEKVTERHEVDE